MYQLHESYAISVAHMSTKSTYESPLHCTAITMVCTYMNVTRMYVKTHRRKQKRKGIAN